MFHGVFTNAQDNVAFYVEVKNVAGTVKSVCCHRADNTDFCFTCRDLHPPDALPDTLPP